MAVLERNAADAAHLLKSIANESRLLILCRLAGARELPVNEIARGIGLSQSALSQHLARMRAEGLVATRREGTTIFYRIADPVAARVLALLKDTYCPPPTNAKGECHDQPQNHLTTGCRRTRAQGRGAH